MNVDEAAFSRIVGLWGQEVLSLYGEEELSEVAMDGKTLHGTREGELPAVELIAALSHELGVVLGQVEVPAGINEIPTIQTLLDGRKNSHPGCPAYSTGHRRHVPQKRGTT